LEYDFIVIDEFSMVDTELFANLLKACANVTKILVVGDSNQLPSVGPGNVLHDLVMSGKFTHSNLVEIHRQAQESGIIDVAYKINSGDSNLNFDKFDDIK
jgi:exodeoxyribonuclease V alpha subunit